MSRPGFARLVALSLVVAGCGGSALPSGESAAETTGDEAHEDPLRPAGDDVPAPSLRPTSTRSFSSAKSAGWDIFAEHPVSFYCGCDYERADPERAGVPDHESCGYEAAASHAARANRIEWEHIVPAARIGQGRTCWTRDDCTRPSTGAELRGRECCEATDEEFAMMHSDLHNLVPAIGQVNAVRSNHSYGDIDGEERLFGSCDFEDDGSTAEPPASVRGDIARAYLYMRAVYGLDLTPDEEALFDEWHHADPPDEWERGWNQRVADVQGNLNPLISAPGPTLAPVVAAPQASPAAPGVDIPIEIAAPQTQALLDQVNRPIGIPTVSRRLVRQWRLRTTSAQIANSRLAQAGPDLHLLADLRAESVAERHHPNAWIRRRRGWRRMGACSTTGTARVPLVLVSGPQQTPTLAPLPSLVQVNANCGHGAPVFNWIKSLIEQGIEAAAPNEVVRAADGLRSALNTEIERRLAAERTRLGIAGGTVTVLQQPRVESDGRVTLTLRLQP